LIPFALPRKLLRLFTSHSRPEMKSVDEQLELIRRGTEQIEPADGLHKKLEKSIKTGKPLRVKYGIDPTGIDVHLGHTVPLRKLRQFQELGHQAVLIIGNYTALVGDPSGRDETRTRLTQEQVEANAEDYLRQIGRIIDMGRTEVRRNGEWFGRFTFVETMSLMSRVTVQRMLERDDFSRRFRAQPESLPIYLHECLYPLMQGHDSVEIQADVELGGSEQLFNLMMGRRLQEAAGQEPQVCITLPILRGLDGTRRMGKSLGNYVGVGMSADEQFAKTMSLPDEPMKEWFTLLTERSDDEIEAMIDPARTHPMEAKKTLGRDIVAFYHGAAAADQVAKDWVKQHSQGHDPENMPEVAITSSEAAAGIGVLDLLVRLGFCKSKNEARNKVTEGAVSIGPDRTKVNDPKAVISLQDGLVVRLGAKKIARVRVR
jgi:tyrosyl-tRNA synthetase